MKKKATLAVGSLLVLTLAYFAVYALRTTRPEALRRLIAQNVKVDSSPDDVIRFLDSQHLEHSRLLTMPEFSTLHHAYGDAPMIVATKRRTLKAWWGFESIQIVFVFDNTNHLIRFDLRPEYTSL